MTSKSMSNNTCSPQEPTGTVQYHSDEHRWTPGPSALVAYPSSGAFQHLPIRRTVSGAAAQAHPNADKIFLRDLPAHCYTLPFVTLNFTIVEIIALLPNWFKNKVIAARFMNNDLTANVHFMVLKEYRDLQFETEHEGDKVRKTLTDEYRKMMRKTFPSWTKLKHTPPFGWDPMSLAVDDFVPDDLRFEGYRRPASIPFRDLMIGVKKLPEDTDAGDLTRALQFAMNSPQNYMFPDDLPKLLEHLGRTQITIAHTDRSIVRRYVDLKRKDDELKKPRSKHDWGNRPSVDELVARMQATEQAMMNSLHQGDQPDEARRREFGVADMPLQQGQTNASVQGPEQARTSALQTQAQQSSVYSVEQLSCLPSQLMLTMPGGRTGRQSHFPDVDRSVEEMDALLLPYLGQNSIQIAPPPANPQYAPRHLLRDCIEGDVGYDGSALARAARFAKQPDQLGTDWYVENVPWLVQLLDAA